MISIGANGEKITYGIKHYNVDTNDDLISLSKNKKLAMGCTCFVINTSKYYMINGNQEWIEIAPFGKTVNSGGNGGGVVKPDEDQDDIIYEGGVL